MNNRVDASTLAAYQGTLDRVYECSHELMAAAPSWQAALYQSLRTCYTEMSANPAALRLHFIATFHDPAVHEVRRAHRARLLSLLDDTRADAPERAQSDMLLSTIHKLIREQVIRGETPPDLDTAERTFATLLFDYDSPQRAR